MTLRFFDIGQDAGNSDKKGGCGFWVFEDESNQHICSSFLSIYNLHGYMNHTRQMLYKLKGTQFISQLTPKVSFLNQSLTTGINQDTPETSLSLHLQMNYTNSKISWNKNKGNSRVENELHVANERRGLFMPKKRFLGNRRHCKKHWGVDNCKTWCKKHK